MLSFLTRVFWMPTGAQVLHFYYIARGYTSQMNNLHTTLQLDVHLNTYLQLLTISFSKCSQKKLKGSSAVTWMSKMVFGGVSVVL